MILFIRHCNFVAEQDHVEKKTLIFLGLSLLGLGVVVQSVQQPGAWCAGAGAPLELFLEHCWNFIHKAPPL